MLTLVGLPRQAKPAERGIQLALEGEDRRDAAEQHDCDDERQVLPGQVFPLGGVVKDRDQEANRDEDDRSSDHAGDPTVQQDAPGDRVHQPASLTLGHPAAVHRASDRFVRIASYSLPRPSVTCVTDRPDQSPSNLLPTAVTPHAPWSLQARGAQLAMEVIRT
jgi:hypothetical protein